MVCAACVVMQRNEGYLLKAWVEYHGRLFAFEDLSIIDHGSESSDTIEILDWAEGLGVFVDRSHCKPQHYAQKGEIVSKRLEFLRDSGKYDFLFPLDCDEMIVKFTDSGVTCDRHDLHNYLSSLLEDSKTLRINYQLLNVPGRPGFFYIRGGLKTFYAADSFGWTDHGYHLAGSRGDTGYKDTDILYAHFHNRPFASLVDNARRKIARQANPDDKAALKKIIEAQSPGAHLAPYFFMSPEEYINGILERPCIQFRPLEILLESMGIDPNVYPVDSTHQNVKGPSIAIYIDGHSGLGIAADRRSGEILPFSSRRYIEANPDVASAGMNAVAHYVMFGYREPRLLYRR